MGLRFGDLTRDKRVGPCGYGGLKVALRSTGAPSQPRDDFTRRFDYGDRLLQYRFDVFGKDGDILEPTNIRAPTQKAEFLFAKTRRRLKSEPQPELRVVPKFRMGVQRQVVSKKIDVVREQSRQTLFHPSRHATILPTPKKPVVNKNRIGTGSNRGFNQGQAGGYP